MLDDFEKRKKETGNIKQLTVNSWDQKMAPQ